MGKLRRPMRAVAAVMSLALLLTGIPVSASVPYNSYVYDREKRPVPAPDAYVPAGTIEGESLGLGSFKKPQDLVKAADGRLYVVDSGNNRIVGFGPDGSQAKEWKEFANGDKTETLKEPESIFVTAQGDMYISDTGNRRILIADKEGKVKDILTKPDSDLFDEKTEFKPKDLVVTSAGTVYALVEGVYKGAVRFTPQGEFTGYYGSNKVKLSLSLLADMFWKKIATTAQKSRMRRYVPVQYSSIHIDSEDFVYFTTDQAPTPSERVRKLNSLGQNILRSATQTELFYGDTETYMVQGVESSTSLVSIDVVDDKYITVLDRSCMRIFQYSQECDLLTAFGCSGTLQGAFVDPMAVCGMGNKIFVLDASKNSVTVFEATPYGEMLHTAIDIYGDGRYQDSLPYWRDILKYNSTSVLANRGIAKALYQEGKSEEAAEYFKKSNDKDGYSDAYGDTRRAQIRANFYWIALGLVLLIVAVKLLCHFHVLKRLVRCLRGGKRP